MSRRALLLLALLLVPWQADAGKQAAQVLLQSAETRRGWVAALSERRLALTAPDGTRRTARVRRDERFLAFSELETGWIASGVRGRAGELDLALLADFGAGVRRLPSPPDRLASLRTGPAALVDGGRLAGLAWLEGDDLRRFAVRAAGLEGRSWGEVSTLSPPRQGSQSGLTAAVLSDGTWLLAWAAHDGRDDEILWSMRRPGGEWTLPRRVAPGNDVPDVTPQLLAHGDGALLAWSRMRGEYEVMTARFDGRGWSAPIALGARGTLLPAFRRLPEADYLVVRNAWPGGWTAFRLDAAGRPIDFAAAVEESRDRPVLRSVPGRGLAFEWAHRAAPETLRWEAVR